MVKLKKISKVKRAVKNTDIFTTNVDNRLSILLLVLAFLIFALAAVAMSSGSNSQAVIKTNPVKIMASPTAKPIVKTVKTVKK